MTHSPQNFEKTPMRVGAFDAPALRLVQLATGSVGYVDATAVKRVAAELQRMYGPKPILPPVPVPPLPPVPVPMPPMPPMPKVTK